VVPVIPVFPVIIVLLVSGTLGYRLGAVAFAEWQAAVETAQVVARLVDYPAGNPFYIYHTKLWTVLHQILAVLLRFGVSERSLSVMTSGLLGMVSFQALALFVYALSRDALLSIGAPSLIFFSRIAESGAVYPISLVGTGHTYGILGLGYVALVAGLIGAGWYRAGLFLLGAAPAVHPSLGLWLVAIVAGCFIWDFRRLGAELWPARLAFAAGCTVTAVSLLVQLAVIYDVPGVDSSVTGTYLAAFSAFWDGHRQPVRLVSSGVLLNVAALAIGVLWLVRFAADVPRPALFLLRFITIAAALSLALALVSWIPPDRLPASLLILMPGRLLNVNAMTCASLLIGIIGIYRNALWSRALLLFLAVGLMLGSRSGLWSFRGAHEALARSIPAVVRINSIAIVAMTVAGLALFAGLSLWNSRHPPGPARARGVAIASPAMRVMTLAVLAWAAALTWDLSRISRFEFLDRTNDLLFQMVSQGNGLLLTGGELHLIQLRTRRPVLLDGGGLDALPYAIEAAPEMERILRDVYSIELLNPPEVARYGGRIPHEFSRTVWEGYTLDRWRTIGNTYGVTQVLVPVNWELKLRVVVRNRMFTVYDIPYASP
jgi:hypothetical protein